MDNKDNSKNVKIAIDCELLSKLIKLKEVGETHSDVVKRVFEMKEPPAIIKGKVKILLSEELIMQIYKRKKIGESHSDTIKEALNDYLIKFKKQLINLSTKQIK